ncbi:hypothetical protein J3R80_05800 [Aliiroseovarius sp. Z3]|uniref:hypothetical protein n=1 Tax=Aliiroseovarius sp. Z3 TaxID=2811402 RepID=UPI0023B242D7|nr:hypothetical protein [Aliiroseovarius sp. Z3]MDE9449980.1 hypothetical protein [Aliiroseovarius sp. Z3]
MDYDSYERTKLEMEQVLQKHLPCIEDVQEATRHLLSDFSISTAMEKLDREDKPPEKDIENLALVARSLNKAAKHLRLVGMHGSADMANLVQELRLSGWGIGIGISGSSEPARDILVELIEKIETHISAVRNSVDPHGKSINTAFGEGPAFEKFSGVGKQRKSAARDFATELAILFNRTTGKKPTVSTDPYRSNLAYGPFLDLVTDAFNAVEINASAEVWAREACKEFLNKK